MFCVGRRCWSNPKECYSKSKFICTDEFFSSQLRIYIVVVDFKTELLHNRTFTQIAYYHSSDFYHLYLSRGTMLKKGFPFKNFFSKQSFEGIFPWLWKILNYVDIEKAIVIKPPIGGTQMARLVIIRNNSQGQIFSWRCQ